MKAIGAERMTLSAPSGNGDRNRHKRLAPPGAAPPPRGLCRGFMAAPTSSRAPAPPLGRSTTPTPAPAAASPAAAAETHLRLCKKVAQLTRVIVALNLRVEDAVDAAAGERARHAEALAAAGAAAGRAAATAAAAHVAAVADERRSAALSLDAAAAEARSLIAAAEAARAALE